MDSNNWSYHTTWYEVAYLSIKISYASLSTKLAARFLYYILQDPQEISRLTQSPYVEISACAYLVGNHIPMKNYGRVYLRSSFRSERNNHGFHNAVKSDLQLHHGNLGARKSYVHQRLLRCTCIALMTATTRGTLHNPRIFCEMGKHFARFCFNRLPHQHCFNL